MKAGDKITITGIVKDSSGAGDLLISFPDLQVKDTWLREIDLRPPPKPETQKAYVNQYKFNGKWKILYYDNVLYSKKSIADHHREQIFISLNLGGSIFLKSHARTITIELPIN